MTWIDALRLRREDNPPTTEAYIMKVVKTSQAHAAEHRQCPHCTLKEAAKFLEKHFEHHLYAMQENPHAFAGGDPEQVLAWVNLCHAVSGFVAGVVACDAASAVGDILVEMAHSASAVKPTDWN